MPDLVELATLLVIFCCSKRCVALPSKDSNEKPNLKNLLDLKNLNAVEVPLNITDLEIQGNRTPTTRQDFDDAHNFLYQSLEDFMREYHLEDLFIGLPVIASQPNDDENPSVPKFISDKAYALYIIEPNGDPLISPVHGTIDKPRDLKELFEENLAKLQLRAQNHDKHFPMSPRTLDDELWKTPTFKDFLSSLFGEEPPPTDLSRNVHPIDSNENLCKNKTFVAITVPLYLSLQVLLQSKTIGSSKPEEELPESRFTVEEEYHESSIHKKHPKQWYRTHSRRGATQPDYEGSDDDAGNRDAEENAEAVDAIKDLVNEAVDSDNGDIADKGTRKLQKNLISRLLKKLPVRFILNYAKKILPKRFFGTRRRVRSSRRHRRRRSPRKRYRASFRMYDDGATRTAINLLADPGPPTVVLQEKSVEPVVGIPWRGGRSRFGHRSGRRGHRSRRGRRRRRRVRRTSRRSRGVADAVAEAKEKHEEVIAEANAAVAQADLAEEAVAEAKEEVAVTESAEEEEAAQKAAEDATEEHKESLAAAEEVSVDTEEAREAVEEAQDEAGSGDGAPAIRRMFLHNLAKIIVSDAKNLYNKYKNAWETTVRLLRRDYLPNGKKGRVGWRGRHSPKNTIPYSLVIPVSWIVALQKTPIEPIARMSRRRGRSHFRQRKRRRRHRSRRRSRRRGRSRRTSRRRRGAEEVLFEAKEEHDEAVAEAKAAVSEVDEAEVAMAEAKKEFADAKSAKEEEAAQEAIEEAKELHKKAVAVAKEAIEYAMETRRKIEDAQEEAELEGNDSVLHQAGLSTMGRRSRHQGKSRRRRGKSRRRRSKSRRRGGRSDRRRRRQRLTRRSVDAQSALSEAIKEHNEAVVVAKAAIVKADEAEKAVREAKEEVAAAASAEEEEVAQEDLAVAKEEQNESVVAAEKAMEDAVQTTEEVKDAAEEAGIDADAISSRRSFFSFLAVNGQGIYNLATNFPTKEVTKAVSSIGKAFTSRRTLGTVPIARIYDKSGSRGGDGRKRCKRRKISRCREQSQEEAMKEVAKTKKYYEKTLDLAIQAIKKGKGAKIAVETVRRKHGQEALTEATEEDEDAVAAANGANAVAKEAKQTVEEAKHDAAAAIFEEDDADTETLADRRNVRGRRGKRSADATPISTMSSSPVDPVLSSAVLQEAAIAPSA